MLPAYVSIQAQNFIIMGRSKNLSAWSEKCRNNFQFLAERTNGRALGTLWRPSVAVVICL